MIPETTVELPELALAGTRLLVPQTLTCWDGQIAKDVPPAGSSPYLRWKGAPLPRALLAEIAAFFRHANETWRSEAQVRLAYNAATGEWRAAALPQTIATGMASKEIKFPDAAQAALREKILSGLHAGGFTLNGTIHSHCDCSAFASSEDERDESTQTGLHVTMGHVSSDEVELHGRVVLRGVRYPVHWEDWLEGVPAPARTDKIGLAVPKAEGVSFPAEWLEACHLPPPPPVRVERTRNEWAGFGYGFGRKDEPDGLETSDWSESWFYPDEPAAPAGPGRRSPADEDVKRLLWAAGIDKFPASAKWIAGQMLDALAHEDMDWPDIEDAVFRAADALDQARYGLQDLADEFGLPPSLVAEDLAEK